MFTRYVLMVFGPGDAIYWRAHWCLLGLLAYVPEPCEIVMLTDHPQYFRWFGDAVRIHAMATAQVDQWQGPQKFFFRTKFKTMEFGLAGDPVPDAVVYMDTDTAVCRPLAPLVEAVAAGGILMDRREYNLYDSGRRNNKGGKRLWGMVGDRSWSGVRVERGTDMWNAGVIALSRADAPLIQQALSVCDAMLDLGCTHRLIEQIAWSAVLTRDGRAAEINPSGAELLVAHYWANKSGWDEAITERLATLRHRDLSLTEAVGFYRENPITRPVWVPRTRKWHRFLGVEPKRR